MADTPNNDRPGPRASLRPAAKAESLFSLLGQPLEDEGKVLEALVAGLTTGETQREHWKKLHEAAVAQERSANLSFAYERLARDPRIKVLPKPKQAEFLLAAANFFADVFEDADAAIGYAERAYQIAPENELVFDVLETLLASSQEGQKLAKLYSEGAGRAKDPAAKLKLLRAAVELLEAYEGTADDVTALQRQIVDLDPTDAIARNNLERLYSSTRRFKELAALLEQSISKTPLPPENDAEVRLRLIGLYRGDLRDPNKAVPHVEVLLSREPITPAALQAAEALVDHRPAATRIAPLLSAAYRKLGRFEDEASTLALELKLARPPRLAEVHRRLAILRQDALGDPAGALELLEPLVARDPTDEDLRRRYLEVVATFHREVEAAKLLSRALSAVKDPLTRARLGLEIAGLYSKHDDGRRARATLEQLLEEPIEDMMKLVLAKRLIELHQDSVEPKGFARALEFVIRVDPDFPSRVAAAKRLVELCDGPVDDPKIAIVAWRTLLGSPRNDEAVDRLEVLYRETGDQDGLAELFSHRAMRAKDPAQARFFALQAADIRAARAPDRAAAIAVWRDFARTYGATRDIHGKLAALLEQQKDFAGLARLLEEDLPLFDAGEQAPILGRLAKIRLSELKEASRGLDALRRALALDPKEATCRKLAEKLLSEGDRRLDTAAILEPVYRAENNDAGVLRILEARAALLPEPVARFAALDEAYRIATEKLSDPGRAFELAGLALSDAARHRRGEIARWLGRFSSASERGGDPTRKAALLGAAVANLTVDGTEVAELSREAAEAFAAVGDLPHAIETYRRVLAFQPSSGDVLRRIDELLAEQGNPEERLALYQLALAQSVSQDRRRELLFSIARIMRRDLANPAGAAATLRTLVEENPTDAAGHQALIDVYTELGDGKAVCAELERALKRAEPDRRGPLVLRLAKELGAIGERARALALYRDVLAEDGLPPDALGALEALAEEQNEPETLVDVLERRIARSTDEREQVACLEKLGDVRARMLGDSVGAVDAWRRAVRQSREIDGESERVRRLSERLLDALPDDAESAELLVDAYAEAGLWPKVPAVLSVLLRSDSSQRPLDLLLSFEGRAIAAGAVDEFIAMLDEALGREQETGHRTHDLMAAKARALSSISARRREASTIWRGVIEAYGKPADVDAYREFLDRDRANPDTFADQRWLFAFRIERASERTPVLLECAAAEETIFQDPERAIRAYEQVLDADAANSAAREALRRLELAHGDPERLLRTLRSLHERAPNDDGQIDLAIAALLVERLDRADEALPILSAALERAPGQPEALRLAGEALRNPKSRAEAAKLVASVAAAAEGPSAEELLSRLIAETRGAPDVKAERATWYRRLVELRSEDPRAGLAVAVEAAEETPDEESLWETAERLARRAEDPKVVADAYRRALMGDVDPALGEMIGRRFVEFHEEWFDEPETVLELLERVLALAPRARWAIDRVKLSYNADARWPELFALYDRAIEGAADDADREDLLDEAAVAAKDLANDSERAIGYLERLNALRPEARVESMLERLYERTGHGRELLALLEKRAKSQKGADLVKIEMRIARLRIELGDAKGAFSVLEHVLGADPDEPALYGLFERLVELPGDSSAPGASKKGKGKRPRNIRVEAVRILEKRYRSTEDRPGLARALEAALRLAESDKERKERLNELVALYADALREPERAYEHLATLVALEPRVSAHRDRLAEISVAIGAEERRARLLAQVAESTPDAPTQLVLYREAAAVLEGIDDKRSAAAVYATALELCGKDSEATLDIARRLDALYAALGRPNERCDALDRLLAVERDPALRSAAFGTLAEVAFNELGDADRAVLAWNARLDENPSDLSAMAGLETVLESRERYEELVVLLARRIGVLPRDESRADRVRMAGIFADKLSDPASAIDTWRATREVFGPDDESFEALSALFERSGRWDELAELVDQTAVAMPVRERQVELYRLLGDLHRDRTKQPIRALEAYVKAGDFARTTTVADVISDRESVKLITSTLIDLAVKAWGTVEPERTEDVASAAFWAVETLVRRHLEDGELEAVVETQLRGASLPFDRIRKRRLRRDAAWTSCDRLEDTDRAIAILKDLFAEDPADEVATASVTRFARLLDESGRFTDLALLWEEQARCRENSGDRAGSAALWARAGELYEGKLGDVERAIEAYRQGAALGGEGSLEALARIHTDRRSWRSAASVLEWLVAQSSREELGPRALRLADAYQNLGDWETARARLEHAAATAIDAEPVRARLAELYRRHGAWEALANLLVAEAERTADDQKRLSLFREAAMIHRTERRDAAAAVPLLERAVEIDPDESSLRLALSEALGASGRYDKAAEVLRAQIDRYGPRRPKSRALVHLHLARVCLAAGKRAEALSELDIGAKINPAHAGILYELGRLAFEEEQYARAERTYRGLLLVLRKPDEDAAEAPGRAEIYMDLAEIAARQGEPERAAELVESAFEAALDSAKDAASLERSLKKSGRYDLLARSVETRLSAASQPALAARALSDLVALHAEHLGVTQEVERRVQADAARILGELETRNVRDIDAWAAMTSVYEWLGDSALEEKALERRVQAMLDAGSELDPEPLLRLARIRLGEDARRDEGVGLVEHALSAGADVARVVGILLDVSVVDSKHAGLLGLLERLVKEPGREADFVRVTALRAEAGPVDAQTIREAVGLAAEFGEAELERRILEGALASSALGYGDRDGLWLRERLARIVLSSGDRPRGAKLLAEAAELADPDHARSLMLEVAKSAATELGELEWAAELYRELLSRNASDREAWMPLLEVYRRSNDPARLISLIETTAPLVESASDRARLRLEEATVMLAEPRRKEAAVNLLKQILDEDPTMLEAADLLAKALDELGRLDELISLLSRQVEAAKANGDARSVEQLSMKLGAMLDRGGRKAEARDVYRTVMDWNRSSRDALRAIARLQGELEPGSPAEADAMERLLPLEEPDMVSDLARRLVEIRTREGDLAGVERVLETAGSVSPLDGALREQLVAVLLEKGDWAHAARVLRRAAESESDRALMLRAAEAYERAGDLESAMEMVGVALGSNGGDADLFMERARLLAEAGRADDALSDIEAACAAGANRTPELISALEAAIERSSGETRVRHALRLVDLLEELGETTSARDQLARLLKHEPKHKDALRRLASLASAEARWDEAAATYRRLIALEEGPGLVDAAMNLADACEHSGHIVDARGGLERALETMPGSAELRGRLRQLYEATGARRELAQLLLVEGRAEPEVSARTNLLIRAAEILLEPDGDSSEAASVLEEVHRLSPENIQGAVLLARAEVAVGRPDEARTALEKVLAAHRGRRSKDLSLVYRELSQIHLEDGDLTAALDTLARAFDLDMRNGELAMQLGHLALDVDDTETAARAFRSVTMMKLKVPGATEGASAESKAVAYYHLSRIAQSQGDIKKARLMATKAVSENPNHAEAQALLKELRVG